MHNSTAGTNTDTEDTGLPTVEEIVRMSTAQKLAGELGIKLKGFR